MKIQMYFDLADGRDCLYQWDLNREMVVSHPVITQLHFCNGTAEETLVCQVREGRAAVPNILLQSAGTLKVYGYAADHTELSKVYRIRARKRPADYVYTETEVRRFDVLEESVQEAVSRMDTTLDAVQERLEKGDLRGEKGEEGKSAYDLAVENGFVGTEAAWLASLKGEPGTPGQDGAPGEDGAAGLPGAAGQDGKSAYEVAVENGFVGSQAEWLASLKGEKGDPGQDGAGSGSAGSDGKSAYEIAVENGFAGTEAAWLASLKGDTGPQGPQGEKGETGSQGPQGPQGEKGEKGADGAPGPQGATGPAGADGATPVAGVDYFTEADKSELVSSVLAQLPDGRTITISDTNLTAGESALATGEVYLVYE